MRGLNLKSAVKPRYLTIKQLSEYSGLSVRTIRNLLKDRENPIPCFRPGGRKILISRPEFNKWMKTRRVKEAKVTKATVGSIVDSIHLKEK